MILLPNLRKSGVIGCKIKRLLKYSLNNNNKLPSRNISGMTPEQANEKKEENPVANSAKVKNFKQQKSLLKMQVEKPQKPAKKRSINYLPGTVNLQFLGTGCNGSPSCAYLFTDQARYLFNCGEGTQRLAHEHRIKLPRLEQIFFTRNTWDTIGGLPGLSLTIQDADIKELAVHSPPYLDDILQSMSRFVVLKNLKIMTQDSSKAPNGWDFEDNAVSVKCIPLYSNVEYSSENKQSVVIAYVCKIKPRPGPLNLEKCVAAGVPPGPLLGELKNGKDVTLENGTVVRSCDVSEPNEVTNYCIFLDIPSEEYLPALHAKSEHFFTNLSEANEQTPLVIHFSSTHILNNSCYQSFIQKFSEKTKHIYLNTKNNNFSGYASAHRIQYQLNQIDPNIFPLLGESIDYFNRNMGSPNGINAKFRKTSISEPNVKTSTSTDELADADESLQHVKDIGTLASFSFRPFKGLDRSTESKLNPTEYINETQTRTNFPELLQDLQIKRAEKEKNSTEERTSYPKIIFLGTGSCIPNKTRNVSSILMQIKENSYVLLDCGEGTLGQIVRFYGKEKAEEVMRNLRMIYVSHLHADHHIGLIGLLNERKRLNTNKSDVEEKKLLLLAPKQLNEWLDFYNENIENISECCQVIGNGEMLETPLDITSTAQQDSGISTVKTCLVRHCAHSFGVSFELTNNKNEKDPIKITYSGDTMPCKDLIELGLDSTVLIHEATMEDNLEEEAEIKMHSTISQAIIQGQKMRAKYTILTHFSQRYAKLPRMPQELMGSESSSLQNIAIAFDNMQLTIDDLEHFNMLYPAISALFAEYSEELEQKALKRELKAERKRKALDAIS